MLPAGISKFPETSELVRTLVDQSDVPIVLDADGLNAFAGKTNELKGKDRLLVITPHPGEMASLIGCSIADVQRDRLGVARKFAHEHELIVVLKGNRTLVVQPNGEAWVNTTGNPGMSTGGSLCRGPSTWSCGGCDARKRRRTFHGCYRSAARLARSLPPRAANRARKVWVLERLSLSTSKPAA